MGDTTDNKDDHGIQSLLKNRRSDRMEEFEQEFESYKSSKKCKRAAEAEFSDEEDDEPSAKVSCQTDFSEAGTSATSTNKGWNLMAKAGYRPGAGLGAKGQGRVEPLEQSLQHGRFGLGHEATKTLIASDADYDAASEIKHIEETPLWLACYDETREELQSVLLSDCIVVTKPKRDLSDEDRYCSKKLIEELLKSKNVFDNVRSGELYHARSRANPYETVKAGFFQNRAAMKTANLDRIFDFGLSREFDANNRFAKNPLEEGLPRRNVDRLNPVFYFADVCAGPGGFSEYMLWRKAFYNAKGFGFTLTGKDDFKLDKFKAASPEYFETYYGVHQDGNVMDPDNLSSLEQFVKTRTHNLGVHLVMCDGGFSVEGEENIQEILSKRLYLCQLIVGLSLCRVGGSNFKAGGNFLCKLFDIFTPFSMGLMYLMYAAFRRISLHKPITSRPANSERYIYCENLTEFGATIVKDYLVKINNRMNKIAEENRRNVEDIYEILPESVIRNNEEFFNYVVEHNERTIRRQVFYLKKYLYFIKNKGAFDVDQAALRDECLTYWQLPNATRTDVPRKPLRLSVGDFQCDKPLFAPFNLEILAQLNAKHLPSNELKAILLPESAEPVLLVSNGTQVGIMRDPGSFENIDIKLPCDTLLLVQITDKYEIVNGEAQRRGQIIYIVDAATLNGDNVSRLPLRIRLMATRKFCDTVNKVDVRILKSSNKRDNGRRDLKEDVAPRYEFICATPLRLEDLVNQSFETRKFKLADIAVFNIIEDQESVIATCRSVRFVNIMNSHCSLNWSKSGKYAYVFDNVRNLSIPKTAESDANPEFHSSFNDCYVPKEGGCRKVKCWYWNWDPKHSRNFTIHNILNEPWNDAGITMKMLRNALDRESEAISNC